MSKATDRVIETYGIDALEKTFENFQYKDKRKILIAAFRKATRPLSDLARSNAPVGKTGNLKRSIGQVPMRGEMGMWIGARVIGGYRGFHGHLVEDGTVDRFYITKKGNKHATGHMSVTKPYSGFFRKAARATEAQAIRSIESDWHDAIARFIIRSKKKDS